jgi:hypothetical protein
LPQTPGAALHQGVLYNVHDNDGGALEHDWCIGIAAAFGVPVLVHGWQRDVVAELSGATFHATQFGIFQRLLAAEIEQEADMPLDGRFLLGTSPLTKGDMVAITVLQRVVERELGIQVDEVGSLGISKEGQSHWMLAVVDDRVAVSAPGGAYAEDVNDIVAGYREDWGCQILDGQPPEFIEVFRLFDWVLHTPAGQLVDRLTSPARIVDQIQSRRLLISGDLGVPSLNQHDAPWPQLAENRFLENLTVPFQYVRAWGGSGVQMNAQADDNARSLLPQLTDILVNGTTTPTTPTVEVSVADRQVTLLASTQVSPDAPLIEAKVIYTTTADRTLRGRDTAWREHAMTMDSRPGSFVATLPPVPPGEQLTYVVAIRERVDRGRLSYWRGASRWPATVFAHPAATCTMPSWR